MTFVYDPTLTDPVSQVRFYIGDTVELHGPRPFSGAPTTSNFSDEEITAILTAESGSMEVSVATFLYTLSVEWSAMATSITIGPRKEDWTRIADSYEKRLKQWQADKGLTGNIAFSSGVTRRSTYVDSRFIT